MKVKDILSQIEYKAEFVPFSQSRNKDQDHKSLNWFVTLTCKNTILRTDYMQGIGHVKSANKPKNPNDLYRKSLIENQTAETGKLHKYAYSDNVFSTMKKHPIPELKDVLYCLLMDSDVLNHSSFEEWANEFGYDTDSIKANKIYQECLAIALKIKAMFTSEDLETLQKFYQDY